MVQRGHCVHLRIALPKPWHSRCHLRLRGWVLRVESLARLPRLLTVAGVAVAGVGVGVWPHGHHLGRLLCVGATEAAQVAQTAQQEQAHQQGDEDDKPLLRRQQHRAAVVLTARGALTACALRSVVRRRRSIVRGRRVVVGGVILVLQRLVVELDGRQADALVASGAGVADGAHITRRAGVAFEARALAGAGVAVATAGADTTTGSGLVGTDWTGLASHGAIRKAARLAVVGTAFADLAHVVATLGCHLHVVDAEDGGVGDAGAHEVDDLACEVGRCWVWEGRHS
mmetsp:Transcript_55621/g.113236  ORF Transcript_55621/g.113236 Transcript_55621/m.113236 type:complete len:285 (+) Transcript_55621:549-1403(+)